MNFNPSKKTIVVIAVTVLFALACSVSGIVPTTDGGGEDTTAAPNALATVLADVASATEKAAATQAVMPDPTETQVPEEEDSPTPTAESASTETPTATPEITHTPSGFPTAIPLPDPQASNFYTCLTPCAADGSNHQTTFPEKIEVIYFRFNFTEFPIKAPYARAWYNDGTEWVRYDCYWPGPEAGVEEITLTDPLGLPSGTWNVIITINGEQVINETLTIQGSWNQWSPPGHFNSCYGKR